MRREAVMWEVSAIEMCIRDSYQIACNIEMLQRAMDNLFSNMHKYAGHSATAIVHGICEGNQYQLYMSNQKMCIRDRNEG